MLAAGADLTAFAKITERDQGSAIARSGHAVFDKLHTSQVPTFAFVNGLALGGGLEITLHCHYRTVSSGATAIAFSECFLGLFPAWGGCFLLPNLVGADRAVQVIIENALSQNKMLTGAQVHQLGIAAAIFDPADFRDRATYADPHQYPTGGRTTVIVNGTPVVENAVHTGALSGLILRRNPEGAVA